MPKDHAMCWMMDHMHLESRCLSVKSVRGGGVPSPTLAAASSEFASCAFLNFRKTWRRWSLSRINAPSKTSTIPRIAATGTPPTLPPAVAVAKPTPCWNLCGNQILDAHAIDATLFP